MNVFSAPLGKVRKTLVAQVTSLRSEQLSDSEDARVEAMSAGVQGFSVILRMQPPKRIKQGFSSCIIRLIRKFLSTFITRIYV